MNEEYSPIKKKKFNLNKKTFYKYFYLVAIALVMVFGVSYSLTFFVQNYKLAESSISSGSLTVTYTNNAINASNLSPTNTDSVGMIEFIKEISFTNTSDSNGEVKVVLERTSGLNLTDMRMALFIDGVIQEIKDVPTSGLVFNSSIMAGEAMDVKVALWPKGNYTGSETTFVGNLNPTIKILPVTGAEYIKSTAEKDTKLSETTTGKFDFASNSTNNYVYFNCQNGANSGSDCEKWRLVGVENDRLVLTTDANYSGASSRTTNELYDTTVSLYDDSLVSYVSTDKLNYYLARTVNIVGGNGTSSTPYILSNTIHSEKDNKVIGQITYHQGANLAYQKIYFGQKNYISHAFDVTDFQGYSETNGGSLQYAYGEEVNFTTNKDLYAVTERNVMNFINFPRNTGLTEVRFIRENPTRMQERYDAAANGQKFDQTYNSGKVLGWQEGTVLYIASGSTTWLTTGSGLLGGFTTVEKVVFENVNSSEITTMSNMFAGCTNLVEVNINDLDTSNVTDMSGLFSGNSSLTSINLSNMGSNNLTTVQNMLSGCTSATEINMSGFNFGSSKLGYENSTNYSPFGNSNYGQGVSAATKINLSNAVASGNTTVARMFDGAHYLEELNMSGFNFGSVTTLSEMLYNVDSLETLNLSGASMPSVTSLSNLLYYPRDTIKSIDLSNTGNNNLTSIHIFSSCANLESVNLSGFNFGQISSFENLFMSLTKLKTVNLANVDTTGVTTMKNMFYGCSSMTSIDISDLDTTNVTDMSNMFASTGLTSINLSGKGGNSLTNVNGIVDGCQSLTTINMSNFNFGATTNLSSLFGYNASSPIQTINFSNANTSGVTNMSYLFDRMGNLTTVDLSGINTSSVTTMGWMFRGCTKLQTLDLSSFNIDNVTEMASMFANDTALTTIYVSNLWHFTSQTGNDTFDGCTSLVGGNGTHYDGSKKSVYMAVVDTPQTEGYLTLKTS